MRISVKAWTRQERESPRSRSMLIETLLRLYAPTLPPGPWPHSIPPPRLASRATSLNENSIRYFLIQDATPRGPYPLPPRLRQAKKRPAGQTRIHADRMNWGNGRKPRSSRRARGRPKRQATRAERRTYPQISPIDANPDRPEAIGRRLKAVPPEPRITSHRTRGTIPPQIKSERRSPQSENDPTFSVHTPDPPEV